MKVNDTNTVLVKYLKRGKAMHSNILSNMQLIDSVESFFFLV